MARGHISGHFLIAFIIKPIVGTCGPTLDHVDGSYQTHFFWKGRTVYVV